MTLSPTSPRKALNKAYLRSKPKRVAFDRFRESAGQLLANVKTGESEEFHKNLIADFLKQAFYAPDYFVNTKGRSDLVIHNGKTANSTVGVILEVKSPSNKAEMPTPSALNTKALQELLLYFLRERIGANNLEIRSLVITNLQEWFLFDAADFERLFVHAKLLKQFVDFEKQLLSGKTTDFFYKAIAKPAIDAAADGLHFVHFSWTALKGLLATPDVNNQRPLIPIFKLLSPPHLLKARFSTDSQTLDRGFYSEFLHIVGLCEQRDGTTKKIQRQPVETRNAGSILENTIAQLTALDKLSLVKRPERFGNLPAERMFNFALEISITWINRLVFLKLLEAQLIRYHRGDKKYAFLDEAHVNGFDDLNELFFSVLAKRPDQRTAKLSDRYPDVPYLNSSLFEPSAIEHEGLFVSNLQDAIDLPLFSKTVLCNSAGKRQTGTLHCLPYLLRFLDAYDFSGDGAEEIQEQNKTLINASVLGLLFEKINGYKDGSYFTPGEVTMHICREAVTQAVLDKFNSTQGWNCITLTDLHNRIQDKASANAIINSIAICDPAVGSGHFLVSALNVLIWIKSQLHVLLDGSGKSLRDYSIEIANDELVVLDEDGEFFNYNPKNRESQRAQEALFHEKVTLIENCLFGVDINPTSVKICRLRLWIELLKSSYYRADNGVTTLETLPNIDINIKAGNSLIRRLPLDGSIAAVLKKAKWSVADYRKAVSDYQAARGREDKRNFENLIQGIQKDLSANIGESLLGKLTSQLESLEDQKLLFPESEEKSAETTKRKKELGKAIEQRKQAIADAELFTTSFEWRFEFPQVLDKNGNFVGFDVVVGNPPYGIRIADAERDFIAAYLEKVPDYEIFYLFVNLGYQLLRPRGTLAFILPNTLLFNVFAETYRLSMLSRWDIDELVDCTGFDVFEGATIENVIIRARKGATDAPIAFRPSNDATSLKELLERTLQAVPRENMSEARRNWALVMRAPLDALSLASRLRSTCARLENEFPDVSQGLIAYDKLRGQTESFIKARSLHASNAANASYRPWLWGEDVRPYEVKWNGQEYIAYGNSGVGVANPREPKFFREPRVLVREITSPMIFAGYTDKEFYNDPSIINVLEHPGGRISLLVLLGILNSKVATFYHLHSSPKITKGTFPKILVTDVRNFPLPTTCDSGAVIRLEAAVRTLIGNSTARQGGSPERAAVDSLVYGMYGLNEMEIAIVERSLAKYAAPPAREKPEALANKLSTSGGGSR